MNPHTAARLIPHNAEIFVMLHRFCKCSAALLILSGLLTAVPARAVDLPPIERVPVPTPAYARYKEVSAETRKLLEAGDTAGLEALAARLRESRESLDGGTWLLSSFYDCAVDVPQEPAEEEKAMAFYEKWARERPDSITAQVCLASALTSYAWNARGDGWRDTVTDEGWRLFGERLAKAWEVLEKAQALEEKCPGWYEAAQVVALGQGWSRSRYMKMVDEALQKEPTYGAYYTRACYWLLPRWYGESGDFEKWIAERADTYPPELRDWQYARFVWMADRMRFRDEMIFGPGSLDWERTKRGFEVWLKKMPDNLMVRFEFIQLALIAGDRAALRSQFEVTGAKYFPAAWNNVDTFKQAWNYAFNDGPNPCLSNETESAAGSRLPPKVAALVKDGVKFLGQGIGGLLAGAALLLLALQRRQVWAGVAVLIASFVLGTIFGTLASVVPAGLLWLYLRSLRLAHPPEIAPPSGWLVFLWVIALAALNLGLQIGASILAIIPAVMDFGISKSKEAVSSLVSGGATFLISINAVWISFLALLAVCRPSNRKDWENRLGLKPCAPGPAVAWSCLALVITWGAGWALHPLMDERTNEAMEFMALGRYSPGLFFAAVALAAPVVEELLFRGYAFSGWIQKMGFWGTALISSLLFTLCHIQYGFTGLFFIFVFGLALAALRWKTGSVYPPMAVHFANNLAHCLWIYFLPAP